MKIIPIGRGRVLELWDYGTWSNGSNMVLGIDQWDKIELWCRKAKIYYIKSGNTLSFFKDEDVTTFMLRWA
jgi:hypothetical protein